MKAASLSRVNFGCRAIIESVHSRLNNTAAAASSTTFSAKPFDQIPGPKVLPFIGTSWTYMEGGGASKAFEIMDKQFKKYGPIYLEDFKKWKYINICDPDEFRKVFELDGKHPFKPPAEAWVEYRKRKNYSVGLVNMNNDEWYRTRQALAPKLLRPKEVYDNAGNFNAVVEDIIKVFRNCRDSNGEISDVQRQLFRWSCESVGTYVFDERVGLFEDPPREEALRFIRAANSHLNELGKLIFGFPFYKYIYSPTFKKFSKAQDTSLEIGKKYVDRKLATLADKAKLDDVNLENKAVPLLEYLIGKKELSQHEVIVSAIEVFFAGIETTSTLMTWLLYNVVAHKDIQDAVREEVTSLSLPNGLATPKDLQKMPLMRACIKESQRLFPVVTINARKLNQDAVICGYHIPKETLVVMNNYSATRSEKYFNDPLSFKPQRWLRDSEEKINPFLNVPFGFGARMCIGRRLAETEVLFLMTKLLHEFDMSYDEPEPVQPIQRTTLCPSKPLKLKFKDRV